ncbi:DUF1758 domain-containing protein [Trichonephila clavipes]|nr:DUF1758 domain-containing protein [Trichonephila clavipes]
MNKLLEIEPVKSSSNLKRLRELHDESKINIRNLDSMGIASGNYGHLLIPILLKQLPHDLVVEFHRQKDYKNIGDVKELMKFIKFEIESHESANITLGHSQEIPENFRYSPRNLSYQRHQPKFKHNFPSSSALTTLRVFSDTSLASFGAVAYLRNKIADNNFNTRFVISKSRVAPIKKITLPSLELRCAVIAAKLVKHFKRIFKDIKRIVMWKQVRVKYWILKARQTIKSLLKKCITRRRFNSNPASEVIALLSDFRLTESPPFAVVGVDFAGPLFIKDSDAEHTYC